MNDPRRPRALMRLHRVLISMGIALAVLFAGYQARGLANGREGAVVWLIISIGLGVGLTLYLWWFLRKDAAS